MTAIGDRGKVVVFGAQTGGLYDLSTNIWGKLPAQSGDYADCSSTANRPFRPAAMKRDGVIFFIGGGKEWLISNSMSGSIRPKESYQILALKLP